MQMRIWSLAQQVLTIQYLTIILRAPFEFGKYLTDGAI